MTRPSCRRRGVAPVLGFVGALFVSANVAVYGQTATPSAVIDAVQVAKAPLIDGIVAETEWQGAAVVSSVDPFFRWLESTAVSAWIVESPSLFAFPGILAVHAVGLALLAGLNGALDLRLLGIARSIPPAAFTRVLPIMWFGLWVNVLSGLALVVAYPTKALTNPLFYLKLGLIGVALVILRSILWRASTSSG
jgi:hypothetical protein